MNPTHASEPSVKERYAQDSRIRFFAGAAFLILAVFIAYLPALHGGPVWDDDYMLTENPVIVHPGGLYRIFFDVWAVKVFYPVTTATLWVESRFFGLTDLTGYHVINTLIHAANSILLWRLLRQLKVPGAFLAGGLFALHPLQVESVAWITEHKNTISGFFYLTAMWALLRYRGIIGVPGFSRSMRWWYLLALVAFVIALGAKTTVTTFPPAVLLVIWWKSGRIGWRDIRVAMPFFLLAIGAGAGTQWIETHTTGSWNPEWSLTPSQQILVAGRALWFYAFKLVCPRSLSFAYPRWDADPRMAWQWVFPLSAAGVIILLWALRRKIGRGPLTAALFFAGTLAPALGFFHVLYQRYSFVADHFQYLACIGPMVLAAAMISRLRPMMPAISALILIALLICTSRSSARFKNDRAVWAAALAIDPNSPNANTNYGSDLLKDNQVDAAEPFLKRAVELNPRGGLNWAGLGIIAECRGQYDSALKYYVQAVVVEPNEPRNRFRLGNLLCLRGDFAAAVDQYHAAEVQEPDWAELHDNLGVCLLHLNQIDSADKEFARAFELSPSLPLIQKHLAEVAAARKEH